MKSGKLNKYIVIEEMKPVENEYGEEVSTIYTEKLRTRADVVNDSGARETGNGEIFYAYNKTFILWDYFDKVVSEFDRIIYENKPYRILTKEVVKETKTLYLKTELINE